MSSITNTVLEILQSVSDIKGENTTNTDALRIRLVARSVGDFAKRRFWTCHLIRNATATGDGSASDFEIGSTTYPMRKSGLIELFVGGTSEGERFTIKPFTEYKNIVNADYYARIAYEYYDQTANKWKVHLNAVPALAETIYYSYFYFPVAVTATSDTVICYDMDFISNLVLAYLYDSEEDPENAAIFRNQAEQIMSDMEGLEDAPAINQIKTMPSIYKGIGTY